MAVVPQVIGLKRNDALEQLRAAGFVVNVVQQAPPDQGPDPKGKDKVPPDVVWEQNPRGGTSVPASSAVTIVVNPP
jgi:beta-lactam-binding protein with PASTA domain